MLENRSFDSLLGFLYTPTDDGSDSTDKSSDRVKCASTAFAPEHEEPPHEVELNIVPPSAKSAHDTPPFHGLCFNGGRSAAPVLSNDKLMMEAPFPQYSNLFPLPASESSDAKRDQQHADSRAYRAGVPVVKSGGVDDKQFARHATWPPSNPGEENPHVRLQLYGDRALRNQVDWSRDDPDMSGFAHDFQLYCDSIGYGKDVSPGDILVGSPSELCPVLCTLAQEYGVCDRWFASVPSQTWTNRLFALAATSHGVVNNHPFQDTLKYLKALAPRSVLEHMDEFHGAVDYRRLVAEAQGDPEETSSQPTGDEHKQSPPPPGKDSSGQSKPHASWFGHADKADELPETTRPWDWRAYTHAAGLDMIHALFHGLFEHPELRRRRYRDVDDLERDVRHNNLPAFSFVEPLYISLPRHGKFCLHNDHHPGELKDQIQYWFKRPPVWEADRLILKVRA